jgi:DNA gyrase subunit B
MLASEQVRNLVVALGTAIGDTFDITKLRYHKIIIATDADVDGSHIRTLILTLFYRYFRPILDGGFVYIALPPLYKISYNKKIHYAYTDEGRDDIFKEIGYTKANSDDDLENPDEDGEGEVDEKEEAKKVQKKPNVQRYKGLGEMNAEELKETTMDANNRVLKQVTVDDGVLADQVFDMLMGTDVPARKAFIVSNAKEANIDV